MQRVSIAHPLQILCNHTSVALSFWSSGLKLWCLAVAYRRRREGKLGGGGGVVTVASSFLVYLVGHTRILQPSSSHVYWGSISLYFQDLPLYGLLQSPQDTNTWAL